MHVETCDGFATPCSGSEIECGAIDGIVFPWTSLDKDDMLNLPLLTSVALGITVVLPDS